MGPVLCSCARHPRPPWSRSTRRRRMLPRLMLARLELRMAMLAAVLSVVVLAVRRTVFTVLVGRLVVVWLLLTRLMRVAWLVSALVPIWESSARAMARAAVQAAVLLAPLGVTRVAALGRVRSVLLAVWSGWCWLLCGVLVRWVALASACSSRGTSGFSGRCRWVLWLFGRGVRRCSCSARGGCLRCPAARSASGPGALCCCCRVRFAGLALGGFAVWLVPLPRRLLRRCLWSWLLFSCYRLPGVCLPDGAGSVMTRRTARLMLEAGGCTRRWRCSVLVRGSTPSVGACGGRSRSV